ncbi:MAG: hypothetical protein U9N14_04480 [Pseudomonadota bacterium]|nr:hypothetical protein [Pseudomonadota bacterium]
MTGLALYYHPDGFDTSRAKLMGRLLPRLTNRENPESSDMYRV